MRTARNIALLLVPLVILFVVLQLTKSDDSGSKSSSASKKAPAMTIDPNVNYTATIDTSEGTIVVGLDAAQYPTAVNNFVSLAQKKIYDGLLINRVAKDFVIQSGSPSNTTSGGPGYTVKGEVPTTSPAYPVGAMAFAKSGAEPAGTAGSQWFIVTGSGNEGLSPDYAGLGTITSGLDVAQKIGQLSPESGDGPPTKKVTIKKITISGTPATSTTTAPTTTAAP